MPKAYAQIIESSATDIAYSPHPEPTLTKPGSELRLPTQFHTTIDKTVEVGLVVGYNNLIRNK